MHLTEKEVEDSFPLRFEEGEDRLYDLTKTIQESTGHYSIISALSRQQIRLVKYQFAQF